MEVYGDVDFSELEQHEYEDTPGYIFYTCPKCGGEYLDTFMINVNGQDMCVDCWNEQYNDD